MIPRQENPVRKLLFSLVGDKPDPPLLGPSDRHYLNRIREKMPKKAKNTVILPATDVSADLQAINDGSVKKVGAVYTINGREYEVENKKRLVPIRGAGFIEMDRGAYRALQIYIQYSGDEDRCRLQLDRESIDEPQRALALRIYQLRGT